MCFEGTVIIKHIINGLQQLRKVDGVPQISASTIMSHVYQRVPFSLKMKLASLFCKCPLFLFFFLGWGTGCEAAFILNCS